MALFFVVVVFTVSQIEDCSTPFPLLAGVESKCGSDGTRVRKVSPFFKTPAFVAVVVLGGKGDFKIRPRPTALSSGTGSMNPLTER